MNRLLEIDMTRLQATTVPLPSAWERSGGRLLCAQILNDRVPPRCHPLSSENVLVIAAGLLAGTTLTSSGRISVGTKSPATGTIKESNGGGIVARAMARLNYRAIVITGSPPAGGPYVLVVGAESARLDAAPDLAGVGIFRTQEILRERYGKDIATTITGPAGELRMANSVIAHSDNDGRASRMSGRGGTGSVMASKGLKAIVYLAKEGKPIPLANDELFTAAVKRVVEKCREHPQTAEVWPKYGTSLMIETCNGVGALPTRNFSRGQFEKFSHIGGEHLFNTITSRGGVGRVGHACMPGCVIRCSNVYPRADGSEWVSPLEYETLGLLGPNLEIDDMDFVAEVNRLCNDRGVDTMELGGTLGVLMEAGVLRFGDTEGVLKMVQEIGTDTVMGRLLCSGTETAARLYGVERVPTVKGQVMAAYDPRGIKGMGVTYATSPQGADHTAGHTFRAQIDKLQAEGQWQVSLNAQITMGLYDSLGCCMFLSTAIGAEWELIVDLLNARYGWNLTRADLTEIGKETLRQERAFNTAAGFGPARDRLPRFMEIEPLPPHNHVFDVTAEDLDRVAASLRAG